MAVQTRYRRAAVELTRRLVDQLPEVEAVVLYGSVARGDAHEDSDIDLLLLTDGDAEALRDKAWQLGSRLRDEFQVFTQIAAENVADFRSRAALGYPFQRTIARMGKPLFDRGAFGAIRASLSAIREEQAPYQPSSQVLQSYMHSADEALRDAKILLDASSWDGASNRAYYAMFNAASAGVLMADTGEIRSHRALLNLFRQHVVQRGVEAQYASDLEAALQLRIDADYKPGFRVSEAVAREAIAKAEGFIARMREFLAAA